MKNKKINARMKNNYNKNKDKISTYRSFSALYPILGTLIVSIMTGYLFTKPMSNYSLNQAPLVISEPQIKESSSQDEYVKFININDKDRTKLFEKSSLVFKINSGKVIDSKWYYIDKETWDKYYEILKQGTDMNTKENLVNILPTYQATKITPLTQKDNIQKYNGTWYLNKYDRSVGATVDGYYFLLLTSAKGEKYLYGITISASTFDTSNLIKPNINIPLNQLPKPKMDIPINQLPKSNFHINIVDADEVASSINDPNKAYTGSAMRHMIFINMYQNLKNKLQEEIGAVH